MNSYEENGRLVICLDGRVDSNNAPETEEEINRLLEGNPGKEFLFDAEGLSYISSAGLRVLLAVRKKTGSGFTVRNVSPEVYDVMEVTGFSTFLKVKKKPRAISVEGCPLIGKGAVGEVYRLDADTIVKVYSIDNLPMIENEVARSRQAFLKGIPTAIPFDIVKVGDRYGSVFEMIKARNCNSLLAEEPERLEEITEMYASFLKQVHAAVAEPGELPDAREEYIRYLDTVADVLPGEVCERIRTLIRQMPEDLHIIHGDIQLKNVMLSNDREMILIDMETLSCGNPVFDLAGMYMCYIAFVEDEPDNSEKFLGYSGEIGAKLFEGTLRKYLGAADEGAYRKALDKITLLGYVRFLYVLSLIGGNPECYDLRIAHSREHLAELSARVTELAIP